MKNLRWKLITVITVFVVFAAMLLAVPPDGAGDLVGGN